MTTEFSQQSKLVGTGASGDALQGCSVSLSSDGNTAIVGGGADNEWKELRGFTLRRYFLEV